MGDGVSPGGDMSRPFWEGHGALLARLAIATSPFALMVSPELVVARVDPAQPPFHVRDLETLRAATGVAERGWDGSKAKER